MGRGRREGHQALFVIDAPMPAETRPNLRVEAPIRGHVTQKRRRPPAWRAAAPQRDAIVGVTHEASGFDTAYERAVENRLQMSAVQDRGTNIARAELGQ